MFLKNALIKYNSFDFAIHFLSCQIAENDNKFIDKNNSCLDNTWLIKIFITDK